MVSSWPLKLKLVGSGARLFKEDRALKLPTINKSMYHLGDHKQWIVLTWLKKFVFVIALTLWRHKAPSVQTWFAYFFLSVQPLSTNFGLELTLTVSDGLQQIGPDPILDGEMSWLSRFLEDRRRDDGLRGRVREFSLDRRHGLALRKARINFVSTQVKKWRSLVCSNSLPLASTRWVPSTFSSHCSLSSKQQG